MPTIKHKNDVENIPTNGLMRAVQFGHKDLELNRAGQMSNDQRRRLQGSLAFNRLIMNGDNVRC